MLACSALLCLRIGQDAGLARGDSNIYFGFNDSLKLPIDCSFVQCKAWHFPIFLNGCVVGIVHHELKSVEADRGIQ